MTTALSPASVPVWFAAPVRLLWTNRHMLIRVTVNDLRARYAGSILGKLWLAVYPLLFLGVYSMVFLFILRVRLGLMTPLEYVALVFSGLVPFLAFNEGLGMGVSSIVSNANLVKNTLFPIELVPVKAVLMGQATQMVGSGMLFAFLAATGKLNAWAVLFPVVWLAQLLLSIGLMWILSSLTVFLRDLQSMVTVVSLLLMMLSPIAYTADMVPPALEPFLAVNPLYYMIVSYQDLLVVGRFPRDGALIAFVAMSLTMFFLGYFVLSRLKSAFVDHV